MRSPKPCEAGCSSRMLPKASRSNSKPRLPLPFRSLRKLSSPAVPLLSNLSMEHGRPRPCKAQGPLAEVNEVNTEVPVGFSSAERYLPTVTVAQPLIQREG